MYDFLSCFVVNLRAELMIGCGIVYFWFVYYIVFVALENQWFYIILVYCVVYGVYY